MNSNPASTELTAETAPDGVPLRRGEDADEALGDLADGPAVPAYGARVFAGRRLPRQGEVIEEQGLAFDVDTLLQRRGLLKTLGFSALAVGLAACSPTRPAVDDGVTAERAGGGAVPEIPDETAGPYPGNGTNGPDALHQSGVIRSDIRSSYGEASGTAEGVLLDVELQIVDIAAGDAPFAGAAVYVWQADRAGHYSMYSAEAAEQNYLRGVQIAGPDGRVRFRTIFPGCYHGRWPHIHFEVYPDQAAIVSADNAIAVSQIAFPEDACDEAYAVPGYEASVENLGRLRLGTDLVFGDDGGERQLADVVRQDGGFQARLTVGVDTRTESHAGWVMGSGPGTSGAMPGRPGHP
ncbi:3,4-dioxygenase subunit beta [Zhihengliuella sp.]|uniref:dioxygenase family protein n=1 Tax=Zhihengliuella sp. TaxID=1954483 RepID=UPI0028122844|nr:3,4-dioxygenase subunit beta [Zhihengliuella sp.]